MKKTKVTFSQAVVLNSQNLIKWLESQGISITSDWTTHAHHMTIEFYKKGVAKNLLPLEDLIGSSIELKIKGYALDDKALAILLDVPSKLSAYVKNEYPHITIATAPGTSPKYSNELLASEPILPLSSSHKVKTVIGWKSPKGDDMFELPWEFSVPMPSYEYTEGISGAGSWNSTPQRVRVYANELMEAGFMNESSARSAWKNTDKLEALIRTINPRLP
jgi:hypothetical protein